MYYLTNKHHTSVTLPPTQWPSFTTCLPPKQFQLPFLLEPMHTKSFANWDIEWSTLHWWLIVLETCLWNRLAWAFLQKCWFLYIYLVLTLIVSNCWRPVASVSLLGEEILVCRLLGGSIVGTAKTAPSQLVVTDPKGPLKTRGRDKFLKPAGRSIY